MRFIIIVILVVFTVGCASISLAPTTPAPAAYTAEVLPTATVTRVFLTLTPSPAEATATSTIVLPPEKILRYEPLEISPRPPLDANPSGALVLFGFDRDHEYRLDFAQHHELDFPENTFCWSTSPDGKWLAYCQHAEDSSSKDWLIVESADGEVVNRLPIGKDWDVFMTLTWLDNQRLVFNLWKDRSIVQSIHPVVVVNPFTGDQQELASDYPDLRPSGSGPGGSNFDFVYSTVVYHPSLNLVVYPQTTQDGFFVVLWDRQAQRALAKVKDLGGFGRLPLWSPGGEQFVIAVIHKGGKRANDFSEFIEEWFSVSREGQVQQLTHFGDIFDHAKTGLAKWSPDGKRLAFWLTTKPSLCSKEGQLTLLQMAQLAVIEMETRQVTNYCVPTVIGDAPMPVWSPDGQYIAVESRENNSRRVILVDIQQGWAARIGESAFPLGWLAAP